jgi:hypothetical protein
VASFSRRFPRAVHILPLHAIRGVLEDGALLAKSEILRRKNAAVRTTTWRTDLALGICDYVHFYLSGPDHSWEKFPILEAQLLSGDGDPPFPHVGLEARTELFDDDDCTLCFWNAAVSRPAVQGYCKGGNWTRGTDPAKILEIWRRFRAQEPNIRQRRGYWNDPIQLPTLRGDQIRYSLPLLGLAPRRMPEMLLRSPVSLGRHFTLWVFSEEDTEALARLGGLLQHSGLLVRQHQITGYQSRCYGTRVLRARISAYFTGERPFPGDLDFDRRR